MCRHFSVLFSDRCSEKGSITNIGYINRNCAEYINHLDITADESSELALDNMIVHVSIEEETHGSLGRSVVKFEPYDVTFGKKGKEIGEFQDVTCITCLSVDTVLTTDMINGRMQCCKRDGTTLAVYGGEEVCEPWSACIKDNELIVMTSRRRRVVKVISKEGDVLWSFGAGFFQLPCGVCIDDDGHFIVTDAMSHHVSIHDSKGKFVRYLGDTENNEQQFSSPRYVCVSPRGEIIVSDSGNHCIKVFDKNGQFIRSFGRFGKNYGELKSPYGVCTDKYGHILVSDHYNNRISMFTPDGEFVCHVLEECHGIVHPKGLALSSNLNLYVSVGHLKACYIKVFKLFCQDPTSIVMV